MTILPNFRKAWLIALFVMTILSGSVAQDGVLYEAGIPAGFASRKIPKYLLDKDMQFWQCVMEESHVNIYHTISRGALLELRNELLASLPDSVTHAQASIAISRMAAALDEGHIGLATNRVIDSLYAFEAIRFPFLLADVDENGLIVQRELTKENRMPAFSRIIGINGIPAAELVERYQKLYGGLPAWRRLLVKNNIRKLLYMDSIVSPFTIKGIINTDTIEFVTEGYTRMQADSISKLLSAGMVQQSPFSLRFLENNIAVIDFNSMDGKLRDSFAVFLERSFAEIKNRNARGLIIDIRKNGGGDSGLGDLLLSYITGKPYRNVSGMKLKISEHSKAYNKMMGLDDPFFKWKNGSLYEYKVDKLITPVNQPLRFHRQTAVLIGTGTFSSANMLTNAIKDYQLATLIGGPTAEPGNDFGEIRTFMLPHSRIVATTAIKMFMRANGDENDFTGIQPDIEVKATRMDILQKKDQALLKAVEWVSTDNRH